MCVLFVLFLGCVAADIYNHFNWFYPENLIESSLLRIFFSQLDNVAAWARLSIYYIIHRLQINFALKAFRFAWGNVCNALCNKFMCVCVHIFGSLFHQFCVGRIHMARIIIACWVKLWITLTDKIFSWAYASSVVDVVTANSFQLNYNYIGNKIVNWKCVVIYCNCVLYLRIFSDNNVRLWHYPYFTKYIDYIGSSLHWWYLMQNLFTRKTFLCLCLCVCVHAEILIASTQKTFNHTCAPNPIYCRKSVSELLAYDL